VGKSTVEDIRTGLPAAGKISPVADTWTPLNKLAFLAIVAYWISNRWQMEEAQVGFEPIRGSHMGLIWQG